MPTVTDATEPQTQPSPTGADPAARVRRVISSSGARSGVPADSGGLRLLDAALGRFDAPVDIRVRGGLGSGRRTLAAALRARRGWRASVDDLDALVAPGAPVPVPPDVEIVCLRTAPCRHEEAWIRRPRRHGLLVVATGVNRNDDDGIGDGSNPATPHWARGLPSVDAREPSDGSVDLVVAFVDRALRRLAEVRVARLSADLEELCSHGQVGDLAEAALCSLDESAPR
ncbi:hypothetical protein [Dietzia alimentaria]|uniref:hypothetical protein n=1 Tax=Dietzia alimentaria TaxID=665550 RepID=UPI001145FBD1|nr:hypothetical protein [Dietzia alimentaria]